MLQLGLAGAVHESTWCLSPKNSDNGNTEMMMDLSKPLCKKDLEKQC